MSLSLEIVLGLQSLSAKEVWRLLRESHPTSMGDTAPCRIDEHEARIGDVAKAIEASRRDDFEVEIGGGVITYGHAADSAISLVFVENHIRSDAEAEVWVKPFLSLPSFRQARLYDHEYDYWQNAEDPLLYQSSGRSHENLPMRSNGLPPPLEQRVIDTSGNPGRRTLRQGFVESVSAVMWVGKSFWRVAGVKKEPLLAQEWLQISEFPDGAIRIKVAEQPFASAAGEAGAIQNKLRALLFQSLSFPVSA